ncbi:MAG: fatty acid desaturase, partial [Bdellovibrionales bacterium]|nr:fatty acid desaturase [Bdellovibrionales bacterium]
WIVLAIIDNAVLEIAAVLVIAGRFHALGVILHDAAHSRRSPRNTGTLFSVLCAYPIATTLEAMKYHHLRHHHFYGTELDPYLKRNSKLRNQFVASVLSVSVTFFKASALVPVWIVRPVVAIAAMRFSRIKTFYQRALLQDREQDLRDSQELTECLNAEAGQLGFWIALLSVVYMLTIFSALEATTAFKFYFLPLWLAGFVNVWRVLFEHDHSFRKSINQQQDIEQVWATTARISVPGFDWFFAPRNIGFHQAHHLYPTVGLKDLPQLHLRLVSTRDRGVVRDSMAGVPISKGLN